ncbi:MAG: 4Fe-4S dicluster domain-containing protein [Clostridia bacterium]|nr:4Fe-4S dicluster domain-containing protein [Clostridia bacterium]
MNIVDALCDAGFARVIVLDGSACGCEDAASILLAFWPYEAEKAPAADGAWVHPYYDASQKAYETASRIAREFAVQGLSLRDDIRVKPIFARLPGLTQGRNTLSYTAEWGSRFHVQILVSSVALPATENLEQESHALHCGTCRRCVDACPTNALEGDVFHRERCLRNWQLNGQPVPEMLRSAMGNRLIGCDVCQRVCPHNATPAGESHMPAPLEEILSQPKASAAALRPRIGANLAIANRVLAQACLIAGNTHRQELLPLLLPLLQHPSATVAAHAAWAVEAIKKTSL